MTSLEFFQLNNKFQPKIPCEWGTGKSRKESSGPPDDNAPPPWHYTNNPKEQPTYQVSVLQLSNNRPNDELIPRPEHFDASRLQILRPFPSEHPYSSHISRFAVFPTSANGNIQRKRHQKVVVLQKAKGFDARIEKIIETDNNDFLWPEIDSDHIPNSVGPKTTFYPIPPKLFLPNDDQPKPRNNDLYFDEDERKEEKRRATEDAAAETERKRWMTTYRCNSQAILDQWKTQNLQHIENNMPRLGKIRSRIDGAGDRLFRTVSADSSHPRRKMALIGRVEDRTLNGTRFSDLPSHVNPGCSSPLPHCCDVSTLDDCGRRSQGKHQISHLHFDTPERMASSPGDSKSEIHKKFDQCFPSRALDLRLNSCLGKKHTFYGGINSQVLRGSTFVTA